MEFKESSLLIYGGYGLQGRGLAPNRAQNIAQKSSQNCVPLLLRGHRKNCAEKRSEPLA